MAAPPKLAADHRSRMAYALDLARQSPPRPSNYRVGALLVDAATGHMLSTGYTLELPGNTHAEQCCFMKLAARHGVSEDSLPEALLAAAAAAAPSGDGGSSGDRSQPGARRRKPLALYTTMEPCSERLSGNLPCVQRVLRLAEFIGEVYVGVLEPQKFVANNTGRKSLEDAGIAVVHVEGLEDEILKVATAGHVPAETAAEAEAA